MTERRPSGPVVQRCIEVNRYHPLDQHFEAGRLEHRRVVGGCRHPGQAGAHLGEPGRAGSIEALQHSGSAKVGVVGDEAQRIRRTRQGRTSRPLGAANGRRAASLPCRPHGGAPSTPRPTRPGRACAAREAARPGESSCGPRAQRSPLGRRPWRASRWSRRRPRRWTTRTVRPARKCQPPDRSRCRGSGAPPGRYIGPSTISRIELGHRRRALDHLVSLLAAPWRPPWTSPRRRPSRPRRHHFVRRATSSTASPGCSLGTTTRRVGSSPRCAC